MRSPAPGSPRATTRSTRWTLAAMPALPALVPQSASGTDFDCGTSALLFGTRGTGHASRSRGFGPASGMLARHADARMSTGYSATWPTSVRARRFELLVRPATLSRCSSPRTSFRPRGRRFAAVLTDRTAGASRSRRAAARVQQRWTPANAVEVTDALVSWCGCGTRPSRRVPGAAGRARSARRAGRPKWRAGRERWSC
jgi:hypothetical protein